LWATSSLKEMLAETGECPQVSSLGSL